MTNIVGFRPNGQKQRKPRAADEKFELLFFTGVRYMRPDERAPEPASPRAKTGAPARRKRHA